MKRRESSLPEPLLSSSKKKRTRVSPLQTSPFRKLPNPAAQLSSTPPLPAVLTPNRSTATSTNDPTSLVDLLDAFLQPSHASDISSRFSSSPLPTYAPHISYGRTQSPQRHAPRFSLFQSPAESARLHSTQRSTEVAMLAHVPEMLDEEPPTSLVTDTKSSPASRDAHSVVIARAKLALSKR